MPQNGEKSSVTEGTRNLTAVYCLQVGSSTVPAVQSKMVDWGI